MLRGPGLAVAVAIALSTVPSRAADCPGWGRQADPAIPWIGVIAFVSGNNGTSRNACFATEAECMSWLGRSASSAGLVRSAYCRNLVTGQSALARNSGGAWLR